MTDQSRTVESAPAGTPAGEGQPVVSPAAGMHRWQGQQRMLDTLPPWLDKSLPWLVSSTLHLGFLLLAIFVLYLAHQKTMTDDRDQIIIPTSFSDPSFATHEGPDSPGASGDPSRAAAQAKLKDLMKADGWSQSDSNQNVAGLLAGQTSSEDLDFIRRGAGGAVGAGAAGSGDGGGPIAPYGTPGGSGGITFKSTFYGTGGNAKRIVYILDHSGSMLDNFDYLKQETKRSVGKLVPLQFFSVIMVSETSAVIGPGALQRATDSTKHAFMSKLDEFVAEGQNDDLLPPFQEAFQKAFAMKPQLIYFLTDGHFDPRLTEVVSRLNASRKVRINTLAFVNHDPSYEDQLKELATKNGGVYHFVSAREAEGQ